MNRMLTLSFVALVATACQDPAVPVMEENGVGPASASRAGVAGAGGTELDVSAFSSTVSTTGVPIVDLGTLGGDHSIATDINQRGQVLGESQTVSGEWHVFVWSQGTTEDLGTLGGDQSWVGGINDRGQVAGDSKTAEDRRNVFLWERGEMWDLGFQADAHDINNRGQIVGVREIGMAGETTTFLWDRGDLIDLGTFHPEATENDAMAVNDRGQIVVFTRTATGEELAFLWDKQVKIGLVPMPGGGGAVPYDINNRSQVVGRSSMATGGVHAALWEDGRPVDLGTLGGDWSEATAVNEWGLIVGWSRTATGAIHAFVWDGAGMKDLGTLPGGTESWALGANNRGQIVGYATTATGQLRAVMWH